MLQLHHWAAAGLALIIGVGLAIFGFARYYILFYPARIARARAVQALELLTASYTETPGRITIQSAGVTIRLISCAWWCILRFYGQDWTSTKANYLKRIIIKYQRFGR